MFNYESIKELNDLEIIIYNYVISNPEKVIQMPIRALAKELHVSTSSILRFCSKLGYEGYSEFKYKLKDWLNETNHTTEVVNDFMLLRDFFEKVGTPEFEQRIDEIAEVINSKNRVVFIGTGTSGILAEYGARYMSNLGKTAFYIDDAFYPINDISYDDAVVVVLSVSGEKKEVIDQVNTFKRNKATIVSITDSHKCTLANISDYNIAYYMPIIVLPGTYNVTSQVPLTFILENLAHKVSNLIFNKK